MTALERYERLESDGLWRPAPGAQRRDVTVSFGNATLVLTDRAGRPLAHWSMPALERLDGGEGPALYAPDADGSETLEIDDSLMVGAIEEVRRALRKPGHGRRPLRWWMGAAAAVALALLAVFWLPGALDRQALAMVPGAKRAEIGAAILARIEAEAGPLCADRQGAAAARQLAQRVAGPETDLRLAVLPRLAQGAAVLPGRIVLLDGALLRQSEDPAIPAGYLLMAREAGLAADPLARVLDRAGLSAVLRLLVTGDLPAQVIAEEAEAVLGGRAEALAPSLPARFAAAALPLAPFRESAAARGWGMAEGAEAAAPLPLILPDDAWVSLQNICAG